ncbi:DNA-binding protein [Streptomyces sp. NBC_00249]|uniref:DNA-binding protein n=1 Tax=Streptomyces sp. NBC_00249 TaxID=2975690 RepID=UPI00224F8E42|nr:DNA-binding protein [Streptomyces sp. NBC_00249]MCX5196031.1 DNA-binding protein [Streptomyces sp. NBC_00249]
MTRYVTAVLDSQGLSALIEQDRKVTPLIRRLQSAGTDLVVCTNTLVEVSHARVNPAKLNRALSAVKIEAVTAGAARAAAKLLKGVGLHGHEYAVDATVAEMALRQPGPVVMLTSDVEDMRALCGDRVRLVAV